MTLTSFYGTLLFQIDKYPLVKDHLSKIADKMLEGVHKKYDFIFREINNYHKDYLGVPIEELRTLNLSIDDCKTTIANQYGFDNWKTVEELEDYYDGLFEKAVNTLISGNFEELKKLIKEDPSLVVKRSTYGHKATLLHYAASNGVEMWRQKTPLNLPEMTQFLIDQGADPNATMHVYSGYYTTLDLLKSSIHPFEAGIAEEMINVLQ